MNYLQKNTKIIYRGSISLGYLPNQSIKFSILKHSSASLSIIENFKSVSSYAENIGFMPKKGRKSNLKAFSPLLFNYSLFKRIHFRQVSDQIMMATPLLFQMLTRKLIFLRLHTLGCFSQPFIVLEANVLFDLLDVVFLIIPCPLFFNPQDGAQKWLIHLWYPICSVWHLETFLRLSIQHRQL